MMVRRILRKRKETESTLYDWAEKGFAFTFLFNRTVGYTLIGYNMWVGPPLFIVKILISAIYLIGFIWCFQI